ncbi:hypothetical protein VCHENC02_4404A, partial [Vibrio harveyi]
MQSQILSYNQKQYE